MNIGTDIIEIARIETALSRQGRFKERVFTTAEIEYCEGRGKQCFASFAGVYAAKEAFVKALGIGFREGSWQEIEVTHDKAGAPVCSCSGTFATVMSQKGYNRISLSISHCKEYAVGQILLWRS